MSFNVQHSNIEMFHKITYFYFQQRPSKPEVEWLQKHTWHMACDLNDNFEIFKGIQNDLTKTHVWVSLGEDAMVCFSILVSML